MRFVLLTYIDESSSDSKYFIAGLVVPDHEANALRDDLDYVMGRVAARASGAITRDAELHGHEMYGATAKGAWKPVNLDTRIFAYRRALTAITDHDVAVILRGVVSKRLKIRYTDPWDPHTVVLAHLLERLDEYAEEHDERALIIADHVPGEERHRADLSTYQQHATPGYRARYLDRLVDTLHFAPSTASRLIQAVDLIVFLKRRCSLLGDDRRARQVNAELWSIIEPKVVHQHLWCP